MQERRPVTQAEHLLLMQALTTPTPTTTPQVSLVKLVPMAGYEMHLADSPQSQPMAKPLPHR